VRRGAADTLKVKELQDLQPGPGQVVIDVQAAGVNFPDVLIVQGKYQFKPELPFVPGSEVAGVIRSVADDVTTFKAGDKVIAFVPTGGFGQQLLAPAQALIPMPPGMDFETAAAITLTYGTSYHAIVDRAMLKNSENMLILGAAGGWAWPPSRSEKPLEPALLLALRATRSWKCAASTAPTS
jgi:NADPH2:quinone reductase